MPYTAAFKTKVRLIDNSRKQQENPSAPPQKLAMDFSLESAAQMSSWLQAKIEEAKKDGSTIRVYQNRDNFDETPGFTMWGSFYEKSGNFSPPVIDDDEIL